MPKKILFAPVIARQGVEFMALLPSDGGYDEFGEWVEGLPTQTPVTGVILPLTADMQHFVEQGIYTTKEKKLLTVTELPEGTECMYKDNVYTIESFKDYTEYTDVHIYVMKWRERKE